MEIGGGPLCMRGGCKDDPRTLARYLIIREGASGHYASCVVYAAIYGCARASELIDNQMGGVQMKGVFDQRAFAASAAALLASHKMSDVVWQTYFPELPAKCPELRTVLIDIHRQALNGAPPNLTEARRQVANQFDIQTGTATDWLDLLQELGFLIRQHGGKRHEFQLVPSAQAKSGLFNVGREYFACLRLVAPLLLRNPAFHDRPHEVDMDWIDDIRATLQADVIDYSTKPADPD